MGRLFAATTAALLMLLAACSDDGGSDAADPEPEDTSGAEATACSPDGAPADATVVDVSLEEFEVAITPEEVDPEQSFAFEVVNDGTVVHEFNVVRGNGADPREPDGSLSEPGPGRLVADVGEIEPGDTCTVPVELEPGTFTIYCNLVVDGTSHADQGMVQGFTVAGEGEGNGGPPPQAPGN